MIINIGFLQKDKQSSISHFTSTGTVFPVVKFVEMMGVVVNVEIVQALLFVKMAFV